MIIETIEGRGGFLSNCYIVGSEETGEGMVIDPSARATTILRVAKKRGLSITLIVATHTHPDHVATLARVKDATGADFLLHEDEETRGIMQTFGRLMGPLVGGSLRRLPKPDRFLREGDIVNLGELNFKVLHTPGHTSGSISLWGHGVVFCGDTLFNQDIGRTDLPGMSRFRLVRSIHNKLMTLPDETRVLPGHGPETTIGFERKYNPFLQER
jgi:glyoxylase-like metal-dependent hydrolase (beta-lactamase superfamily II)